MPREIQLSPDGVRYLVGATGQRVPRPFNGRVLVPWICGTGPDRWHWMSLISAAWFTAAVMILAAHWVDWPAAAVAAILSASIPGTLRFNLRFPVLVDLPAMALAATSAALTVHGHPIPGTAVACIAAATKETSPIFAAIWAWHPAPLAALTISAALQLKHAGPEPQQTAHLADTTTKPIKASLEAHKGQWRNPHMWVTPWGPLALAALNPTKPLLAAAIAAHTQTLIATDTHRLAAWAAPTAAVTLTANTPTQYLAALAIGAVFFPYPANTV